MFHFFASSQSSNVIVLVLALLMVGLRCVRASHAVQGMYFVSMVILMRMNLPAEYRSAAALHCAGSMIRRGIITEVLGGLEFSFYHKWFDVIFLVGTCTSPRLLTQYRRSAACRASWPSTSPASTPHRPATRSPSSQSASCE